jgi:hypothetical protein
MIQGYRPAGKGFPPQRLKATSASLFNRRAKQKIQTDGMGSELPLRAIVRHSNIAQSMSLRVNFCRATSRNARLLYPTKLPRRTSAIETVTGQNRTLISSARPNGANIGGT